MLGDALLATLSNLAAGLLIVALLVGALSIIAHGERKYGEQEPEIEPQIEYEDIWEGFPPDKAAAESSVEFGSERRAA
jgi:hypothetical protein